ncbi:MAG: hypothetical protein HRF40_10890 [Nitrososphaera sp.]
MIGKSSILVYNIPSGIAFSPHGQQEPTMQGLASGGVGRSLFRHPLLAPMMLAPPEISVMKYAPCQFAI